MFKEDLTQHFTYTKINNIEFFYNVFIEYALILTQKQLNEDEIEVISQYIYTLYSYIDKIYFFTFEHIKILLKI